MCNDRTMITRYELVETVIPAGTVQGQINLPSNVSNLTNNPERKIFIKDVECFPDYAQAVSIKNNGTPVIPPSEIPKVSLTLYYNSGVFIRYIPLAKLIYTVPPATVACPYQTERVPFDNLYPVAIEQCFFTFNQAPAVALPYVIVLGFTYNWAPVLVKQ